MTQKHTPCTDFHWIGETLMAKEFGEVVELCNVDWSGLDEFEAEHKSLIAAAPELLEALENLRNKVDFSVGDTVVCTKSQSCAYTEGKTYQVYANNKGWKCIKGDDGLEDIVSVMVSSFKREQ